MMHPHPRGRHRGPAGHPADHGPRGLGLFGPGGPLGRLGLGRSPRARRGDVRAAVLVLLAEDARNGYQLMQEIESRSGGLWRPSPGSIYPVLQQLEDEGLVRPDGAEGRRVHRLTAAGEEHVSAHAAELGRPWDTVADSFGEDAVDLHGAIVQVVVAARQVSHAGTRRQVAEAMRVLTDARRRLYRILADDGTDTEDR